VFNRHGVFIFALIAYPNTKLVSLPVQSRRHFASRPRSVHPASAATSTTP
jgi:hypothetical protein